MSLRFFKLVSMLIGTGKVIRRASLPAFTRFNNLVKGHSAMLCDTFTTSFCDEYQTYEKSLILRLSSIQLGVYRAISATCIEVQCPNASHTLKFSRKR